jgi:2-keto-4-pentenoate hydratase/2-oxohepta-3-ene-1,7-dioic acid hydratase in catechol pathway
MKLVSYDRQGEVRVAVVEGDHVIDAGTDLFAPRPAGDGVPFGDVDLVAPVPRPGKVVCIGLNYRDHAAEGGQPLPSSPLLFAKFANAVVGPGAPIVLPPFSDSVDYEAELGVVIGREARVVSVADALDHVLGYTCLNDVSARDLQFGDGQWTRGKTQDTFCPIGPWLVTSDEIPDPQTLGIQCRVNGQVLQDSNTSEMVFGVAELISFISQGITLEPGDLIATGTPSGVGFARKPPIFLRDGDTVEVSIDQIGTLSNPVQSR